MLEELPFVIYAKVLLYNYEKNSFEIAAAIAQLGERQTEDLKVPGSIPGLGMSSMLSSMQEQGGNLRDGAMLNN